MRLLITFRDGKPSETGLYLVAIASNDDEVDEVFSVIDVCTGKIIKYDFQGDVDKFNDDTLYAFIGSLNWLNEDRTMKFDPIPLDELKITTYAELFGSGWLPDIRGKIGTNKDVTVDVETFLRLLSEGRAYNEMQKSFVEVLEK